MTDAAKDYKCSPCGEYKFFLYDPNDGITFWKTEEDRDKAAETAIDSYLDEEWNEEVSGVVAGVVTRLAVEIDRVDKIGKLDDDGYDEAGEHWPNNDCDYKCNHALKPLDTPSLSLVWTENRPPCEDCRYDHCIAETPFGRFLVTWKGWKEYDSPTVDETPWGDWYEVFNSVDEAKAACQLAMDARLALCFQPTSSPSHETR